MWVHCDLNEFITLNEQMEEEATTRPDILHFFGQEKFLGKSLRILKSYVFLCTNEIIIFS